MHVEIQIVVEVEMEDEDVVNDEDAEAIMSVALIMHKINLHWDIIILITTLRWDHIIGHHQFKPLIFLIIEHTLQHLFLLNKCTKVLHRDF